MSSEPHNVLNTEFLSFSHNLRFGFTAKRDNTQSAVPHKVKKPCRMLFFCLFSRGGKRVVRRRAESKRGFRNLSDLVLPKGFSSAKCSARCPCNQMIFPRSSSPQEHDTGLAQVVWLCRDTREPDAPQDVVPKRARHLPKRRAVDSLG